MNVPALFDGAKTNPGLYGLAPALLRPPVDVFTLVRQDIAAVQDGHALDAVEMGLPEECQTGVAVYRELLEMVCDHRRRLAECAIGREVPHGRGTA